MYINLNLLVYNPKIPSSYPLMLMSMSSVPHMLLSDRRTTLTLPILSPTLQQIG